jgi:hypothetical protein
MAFQAMVEAAKAKVAGGGGEGGGPGPNDIETLVNLRKHHLSQPQHKVSQAHVVRGG